MCSLRSSNLLVPSVTITIIASSALFQATFLSFCRRFRPGTRALLEIRALQRTSNLLIRHLPFQRLVRELCAEYTTGPFRWTAEALLALQEAAEDTLV